MVSCNILTEKEGIPVLYSKCKRGFGVRMVHPQNPKAPSKNLGVSLFYLAPGGVLVPHKHDNEEVYIFLEGQGKGHFGLAQPVEIRKGMFVHIPSRGEHGIENTGDQMMMALVVNSPPVAPSPEWEAKP